MKKNVCDIEFIEVLEIPRQIKMNVKTFNTGNLSFISFNYVNTEYYQKWYPLWESTMVTMYSYILLNATGATIDEIRN